jgi:cation transport ATPase
MKRLLLTSLLLVSVWSGSSSAQTGATVRAEVNGMVCAFCAVGIEKKLRAMPATQSIYVNLAKRTVAVAPKPGARLSTEEIAHQIREAGFDVVRVSETDHTLAQIRAEVTGKP